VAKRLNPKLARVLQRTEVLPEPEIEPRNLGPRSSALHPVNHYILADTSHAASIAWRGARRAQLVKAWIAGSSLTAGGVFFWYGPLANLSF